MGRKYNREDGIAILPAIQLNRAVYPLYVGGSPAMNYQDSSEKGSSFLLEARVESSQFTAKDVSWRVEDPEIVGITRVTRKSGDSFGWRGDGARLGFGWVLEKKGVGAAEHPLSVSVVRVRAMRTGVTKVLAVLPDGSSAECVFTVIDFFTRLTAAQVELNTDELCLREGMSARLFPILYPKDIYGNCRLDSAVYWSSSDENVAIVERGIVTAVGHGTAEIAVCTSDVGRKAVCHVTVTAANEAICPCATGEQKANHGFPTPASVTVGGKLQLPIPGDTSGHLRWVSENRYVADVDSHGVVTGLSPSLGQRVDASGLEILEVPQPVWIYATDSVGGQTAKYPIYVEPVKTPVMEISIEPDIQGPVALGESRVLTAMVSPSAPRTEDVIWSVECRDADKVLNCYPLSPSVSGAPRVRIEGQCLGQAVVTASCGGKTAKFPIQVTEERPEPDRIVLPERIQLAVDQVYSFDLGTGCAFNRKLCWVISDYETATLDREGNLQGYKPGICSVYAFAFDSLTGSQREYLKELGTNAREPENDPIFRDILAAGSYGVCHVEVVQESVYLRNLHVVRESVTDHSVLLLWNRASLLDAEKLREYAVYRDGVRVGRTEKLGCRIENLEPETRYIFTVEAVGENGEVLARQETDVMTKAAGPVLNVLDYGARGDGTVLDTYSIQRTIELCPEGGTVLLPAGRLFVSGALFLKSHMTFRVDGILIGSIDPKDYPRVITRWEGWRKLDQPASLWINTSAKVPDSHCSHASLINAGCYEEGTPGSTGPYNVEDLVICGHGQINANGFSLAYNEGPNINIGKFVGINTYPVQDASLRGSVLRIHNGRNIYVKDVQMAYAPFWTVHTIFCDRITFDGVEAVSMGDGDGGKGNDLFWCGHVFNGDGIDPEHCTHVNIFDVWFTTGDDPVAIKSGRNREGNELDRPNAYFRVTDCISKWSLGGFGTGSESASGNHDMLFQNLYIQDIVLNGIWIKTCKPRGGVTEFLQVRDVWASNCDCPVWIFNNYSSTSVHATPALQPPVVRRMVFENIHGSADNKRGVVVDGVEGCPVTDVRFRGVDSGGKANVIRFAENITGLE